LHLGEHSVGPLVDENVSSPLHSSLSPTATILFLKRIALHM
jgi:hypothetical protein